MLTATKDFIQTDQLGRETSPYSGEGAVFASRQRLGSASLAAFVPGYQRHHGSLSLESQVTSPEPLFTSQQLSRSFDKASCLV
jgi:hypothetical protein